MADKKVKHSPIGSLQPKIDDILEWNNLDFTPATKEEKEDFIQQRKSVSYWRDAWRRLRKNTVAMVAMCVLIVIVLFGFLGPVLVPYGYEEFNKGAENLHPWHYTLEDQARVNAVIEERTGSAALDPEEAVAQAIAEAEAKGETLSAVQQAKIRANAKAAAEKAATEGSEGLSTKEEDVRAELGVKAKLGGYCNNELHRIANGE